MVATAQRLIIDTDVGTDVDDLWTLAMLPASDELAVEAVTLVYGDVDLRARIATVACAAMHVDCTVHAGRSETLSGREVMWAGHEGEGVAGLDDATYSSIDAVDVLIERANLDPGTLHVLAIGPLTNVAAALEREPAFAQNVGHLTVMGGEMSSGFAEHNFSSDPTATRRVIESGISMTILPLDQTLRVRLTEFDVVAIAAVHPLGEMLEDQARRFWVWLNTIVPGVFGESSAAHDPAALLTIVRPDLFTFTPMTISVSDDGCTSGVADETSPIRVVTDLDADAVHAELIARLTNGAT